VTNWEKVKAEDAVREFPGVYPLDIYGTSVPSMVGEEVVGLATDRYILPPWPNRSVNRDPFIDGIVGLETPSSGYRWLVGRGGKDGLAEAEEWTNAFGQSTDVFLSGDFNGDGFVDLARAEKEPTLLGWTVDWHIAQSNGSTFGADVEWGSDTFLNATDLHFFTGDFNGDGCTDIATAVTRGSDDLDWYVTRSLVGSLAPKARWSPSLGHEGDRLLVGDFDGDGRSDVAVGAASAGSVAWRVAISDGTAFADPGTWAGAFGAPSNQWLAGDFNGDGLTDIASGALVALPGGPLALWWRVAPSEGTAFGPPRIWAESFGMPGDHFLAGDFDGDGWTDLASIQGGDWYVARSSDDGVIGDPELWATDFVGDVILD